MKKPKIVGEYIRAYKPKADNYFGINSEHFEFGKYYKVWDPNDHYTIKGDDGRWHSYGITHPTFERMEEGKYIHEGEGQLYHCMTKPGKFSEVLGEDCFEDQPKVLYTQQRITDSPRRLRHGNSPAIVKKDGLWYMFYGPCEIRYATSTDLFNWDPQHPVIIEGKEARDPNILEDNGVYYMTYCLGNTVVTRTSTDLMNWSEKTEIFRMTRSGDCESPLIIKHEDWYYLMWCIWDATDSEGDPYDSRTFVYASKDPLNFRDRDYITTLYAHCPEIIVDEDGQYYITSAHKPYIGVNVAKLEWVEE